VTTSSLTVRERRLRESVDFESNGRWGGGLCRGRQSVGVKDGWGEWGCLGVWWCITGWRAYV